MNLFKGSEDFTTFEKACASSSSSYIGETCCHFKTRIEEHIKKDNKSHIFKHLHSSETCFDSYNSLILKKIIVWLKRVVWKMLQFLSKQFYWSVLKVWTAPIITSWNFRKIKAVLLKCFEILNCPYYHELKFSQK